MRHYIKLNIVFECVDGSEKEKVMRLFSVKRFAKMEAKKVDGKIIYDTIITTEKDFLSDYIYTALSENDFIISITREDVD